MFPEIFGYVGLGIIFGTPIVLYLISLFRWHKVYLNEWLGIDWDSIRFVGNTFVFAFVVIFILFEFAGFCSGEWFFWNALEME